MSKVRHWHAHGDHPAVTRRPATPGLRDEKGRLVSGATHGWIDTTAGVRLVSPGDYLVFDDHGQALDVVAEGDMPTVSKRRDPRAGGKRKKTAAR